MTNITIATLGLSKSGKTAFIASLARNPEEILDLYVERGARTKINVNYEYTHYSNAIKVKKIDWNQEKIACGGDFKNLDGYNKAVEENPIYNALDLKKIDDDLGNNLDEQLKDIEKNITIAKVMQLINMEHIDKYISSLVITIPSNDVLSKLLSARHMTLVLRDTRTLQNIMFENKKSNTKKTHIKSLAELGLNNVNAVLFMGEGDFQNSISDSYKRILKSIITAVPVFLAYKEDTISEINVKTIEEAKEVIEQKKRNIDLLEDRFYEVLTFLDEIKEKEEKEEKDIKIASFNCFNKKDISYFFPNCVYLSKRKRLEKSEVKKNPLNDDTYETYTTFTTYIVCDMINKIFQYYNDIYGLLKSNLLAKAFEESRPTFQKWVKEDFNYYDNHFMTPEFALPQVKSETKDSILKKLCDSSVAILGTHGGITTKNGNKYIYIASLVVGVTLKNALQRWLSNFNFYTPILNFDQEKEGILKNALFYILETELVDSQATFQDYCLIDRYVIEDSIKKLREKNIQPSNAMFEVAGYIFDEFCKKLTKITDEYLYYLIKDCENKKY